MKTASLLLSGVLLIAALAVAIPLLPSPTVDPDGTVPTPNLTEPITVTYPAPTVFPALSDLEPIYEKLSDEEGESATVTFRFIDGVISGKVPLGANPICPTPTEFLVSGAASYTFAGWDPEPGTVTGDVVYTARYRLEAREEALVSALLVPIYDGTDNGAAAAIGTLFSYYQKSGNTETDVFTRLFEHLAAIAASPAKALAADPSLAVLAREMMAISDFTPAVACAGEAKDALDAVVAYLAGKDVPDGGDLLFVRYLYEIGYRASLADYTGGEEYSVLGVPLSDPRFIGEALLLLTGGGEITGGAADGYPGAFTARNISYDAAEDEWHRVLPVLNYFADENLYTVSDHPYVAARLFAAVDDLITTGGALGNEDDEMTAKVLFGVHDEILSNLRKAGVITFETGISCPAMTSEGVTCTVAPSDPSNTSGDGKYLSVVKGTEETGTVLFDLFPDDGVGHTFVLSLLVKADAGCRVTLSVRGADPAGGAFRQKTVTGNGNYTAVNFTFNLNPEFYPFAGDPYLGITLDEGTAALSLDSISLVQNDRAKTDPLQPGKSETVASSYTMISDYSSFVSTLYTPFKNGSSMKGDPQTQAFQLSSKTVEFTPDTYATLEFDYYYHKYNTHTTFYLRSGNQNVKNGLFVHDSNGITIGTETVVPETGWHRFAVEVMQTYTFSGTKASYLFTWNLYIDGVYIGSSQAAPATASNDIVLLYKASKDDGGNVVISRSDYNAYFYIYVSGGEGFMHVKNVRTGISTAPDTFGEIVVPVEYDLQGGAPQKDLSFVREAFTVGGKTYAEISETLPDIYFFYTFANQAGNLISALSPTLQALPAPPTLEGKTFSGWAADSTLAVPYDDGCLDGYPIKLYAKWGD